MSNFYDAPPKFDHSDPDKLKISPITKKREEEPSIEYRDYNYKEEHIAQLALLSMIDEKVDGLKQELSSELILADSDLFKSLEAFKTLFHKLSLEDVSQDYLFAEALSKNWRVLIDASKRKNVPPHLPAFIHTLKSYPPEAEHTIGYYLSKYAGEKWITFPFIDILRTLYENAILKKNKSILNSWILLLCNIIDEL